MRFSRALGLAALTLPMLASAAHADEAADYHGIATRLLEHALFLQSYVSELVMAGYRQQPALVLVLSALLVVPALAIVSLLTQSMLRFVAWHRRPPKVRPAEIWVRDSRPRTGIPAWPAQAWLKVEDDGATVTIDADLLSIGRHQDNVLHLEDASVHRFHAIIHRSDDAHFIITDVSGDAGNGVRINGERLSRAYLTDGDCIELGRARLTFAAVPH